MTTEAVTRKPSYSSSMPAYSSSAAASSSSRTNPISLRIYKALGTTFDDPTTLEALQVASGYYEPAYAASISSAKGKSKAQDAVVEDDSDGDEEKDESPIFRRTLKTANAGEGSSAALARKYLKRDVEAELARGSVKFLHAFGEVDKKLGVLREHMREMQVRCDQVQAELDQANSGTKYLLERADGLRNQRASAQLRSTIINLFLARFTLSEAEQAALSSREIIVSQAVFDALDKVEQIRRDSQALLGGEEGTERAGLDIMAATSEQMESGYTKLHKWCSFEFRQFTREGQLDVSPHLREAIKALRQRPSLLRDALAILHSTRASSLLNQFLDALTRGGPQGLPRPIELHAHDPIRYVGDMLAWVHQATASEHEFLEAVFGVVRSKRMMGEERSAPLLDIPPGEGEAEEEDSGGLRISGEERLKSPEEMAREGLDKDLEGLSRPLRMRIQQTIKSQEGIIMTYRIANLVQFYLVTMRKTIGAEALLCQTIEQIYEQSNVAFLETLDAHGRSLLRFLHPPDSTLTPPLALRDTCQILREILGVYDASLVDEADRESDFAKVLDRAVDPVVEMCERMAEMRAVPSSGGGSSGGAAVPSAGSAGSTAEWEKDIFMVNCLGYLVHTLENWPFTTAKVERLEKMIQRHLESMTFEHHGRLLEQCGLAPIMRTIRTRPADTPLSRLPATSAKPLTAALTTFSAFLTSPEVLDRPRLALLTSPALAESIHRRALKRISDAYAEVCDRVLDKKEGYEFAETLLRRGRDEVEVALGVVGESAPEVAEGDEVETLREDQTTLA